MTDELTNPWPDYPTAEQPYFGDDETYGRELGRVSPEGNVFGQIRVVRDWQHKVWWDGEAWQLALSWDGTAKRWVVVTGPGLVDALPAAGAFGTVCELVADDKSVYYYSDGTEWHPLKWMWKITNFANVPVPGKFVGEAHTVVEPLVLVIWDGFQWTRLTHSMLNDNETFKHLPPGFLQDIQGTVSEQLQALNESLTEALEQTASGLSEDIGTVAGDLTSAANQLGTEINTVSGNLTELQQEVADEFGQYTRFFTPDARIAFVSPTELQLSGPLLQGFGLLNVAGQWIVAGPECNVLDTDKAVAWDEETETLSEVDLQDEVQYWIYLANSLSPEFNLPTRDVRGKLFLSPTADTDDYLGNVAPAENARLVGQVTTTADGKFRHDITISIISRTTNFAETYRDYTDYVLGFETQDQLRMSIAYGQYGQIAIADYLYYLGGSSPVIERTGEASGRVLWDPEAEERLVLDTSAIAADMLYWIYIGADIDALNFNEVNPATGRPWRSTDPGAVGNYDENLDFILRPFLSTKAPENDVMSLEWPGHVVRHIGQIQTDQNGCFINSTDLSSIRQPGLNPSYFDGLAEAQIQWQSETELRVVKKSGTSGVVNVCGSPVFTYESTDADVHKIVNSDLLQVYTESNLTAPLSDDDAISEHPGELVYLYLANDREHWGDLASQCFVSLQAPVNGYLSRNWPGNQARWIATLCPDADGRWTGNYIKDGITLAAVIINDGATSPNETWSSLAIQNELNKLLAMINAGTAYENEKLLGLALKLEYYDADNLKLAPTAGDVTVVFPDLEMRTITSAGVVIPVADAVEPGTIYYVYLDHDSVYLSETAPDHTYTKLQTLESPADKAILVGWVSAGAYTSETAVVVDAEADITRHDIKRTITNWVQDSGTTGHFTDGASAVTIGTGNTCPEVELCCAVKFADAELVIRYIVGNGSGSGAVTLSAAHASGAVSGIYRTVVGAGGMAPAYAYLPDGSLNTSTAYATPVMTSNSAPSPYVASAGGGVTDANPYKVFDQNTATYVAAPTNGWVQVDCGSGSTKKINKWRVSTLKAGSLMDPPVSYITSVKLQGSSDAGSWTDLSTISGLVEAEGWSSYATFTNDVAYRYYRAVVTGVSDASRNPLLREVHLVEQSVAGVAHVGSFRSAAPTQISVADCSELHSVIAAGGDATGCFAVVSFDAGISWYKYSGGSWSPVATNWGGAQWQYHNGSGWVNETNESTALSSAFAVAANQSLASALPTTPAGWLLVPGSTLTVNLAFAFPGNNAYQNLTGWTATVRRDRGHIAGAWNTYSFWNEPDRTWDISVSVAAMSDDVYPGSNPPAALVDTVDPNLVPGLLVPSGVTATRALIGTVSAKFTAGTFSGGGWVMASATVSVSALGYAEGSMNTGAGGTATGRLTLGATTVSGPLALVGDVLVTITTEWTAHSGVTRYAREHYAATPLLSVYRQGNV